MDIVVFYWLIFFEFLRNYIDNSNIWISSMNADQLLNFEKCIYFFSVCVDLILVQFYFIKHDCKLYI